VQSRELLSGHTCTCAGVASSSGLGVTRSAAMTEMPSQRQGGKQDAKGTKGVRPARRHLQWTEVTWRRPCWPLSRVGDALMSSTGDLLRASQSSALESGSQTAYRPSCRHDAMKEQRRQRDALISREPLAVRLGSTLQPGRRRCVASNKRFRLWRILGA